MLQSSDMAASWYLEIGVGTDKGGLAVIQLNITIIYLLCKGRNPVRREVRAELRNLHAEIILEAMELYDSLDRKELIVAVIKATQHMQLTDIGLRRWIGRLCGTTQEVVYSWMGESRVSKIPLKVLAKIAIELHIPLSHLLVHNEAALNMDFRKNPERMNYRELVMDYREEHPDESVREIAEQLNIAQFTVRRHLVQSIENENCNRERSSLKR